MDKLKIDKKGYVTFYAAAEYNGPVYIRMGRLDVETIFDEATYDFQIGIAIFTFNFGYATVFLICSNPLPAANIAKVEANAIFPQVANPAAVPIKSASAIPTLKCLSGNFSWNKFVFVDFVRSASNTTTSLFIFPNSTNASP